MAGPPPSFTSAGFNIQKMSNSQLELAFEEGHDADIPSNTGVYVEKEQISASHHTKSTASARHSKHNAEKDLEKGPSEAASSIASEPQENTTESKKQEEAEDPNIVWWDGDNDPKNPMNWPEWKKWANIALLSFVTFVTPLASSMFAPGVPQVLSDFHSSSTLLATFVVSVYVMGFALGPLVVAPLSELYGRMPLYNICNVFFLIFTIACAVSDSLAMLIVFRLVAGCFGSAALTIGGGTIADLMPQERRGGAIAIWAMGPLLGPVVGPVCGGFLVEAKGWRWVFWLIAIITGAATILCFLFQRETYAPIILSRKAAHLRKTTSNPSLRSKLDTGIHPRTLFARAIARPTKMLTRSPIVAFMSTYTAVVYGILYLLFTTFTFVFEDRYGFDSGAVGLTYIGIGIGMLLGLAVMGRASDAVLRRVKARGGRMQPEHRIPPSLVVPPACAIPAGLFVYGWTAEEHEHWAVPLLGTLFVGFGMIACTMCIQTYLIDAFTVHAASAIAANTVLRSLFGALLPLAGLDMYSALGLGWGNSLLAFVALALVPVPVFFRVYGERIRTGERWRIDL